MHITLSDSKIQKLVRAALIGALYAALTYALQPISYGPIQFRVSEALTVLPFFFPEAVAGLTVGCALANLVGGYGIWDVVFGSLATLLAALVTVRCRKMWLAPLPPVIFNALIVGAMLAFVLTPDNVAASFPIFAGEVALGELGACYGLGLPLLLLIKRVFFTTPQREGSQ